VVIYEEFKMLATRLSIALFLSQTLATEDAREISELMTTHWRGIISVPLSMRVPWYGWKSGYAKALAAKVGGKEGGREGRREGRREEGREGGREGGRELLYTYN